MSPRSQILNRGVGPRLKEYELEVMRDRKDNVVIVCSIETSTRWAPHGDSITVAPAQTLTDKDTRRCATHAQDHPAIGSRRAARNPVRRQPKNGKMYVIEMNPRVSRSSALASKATGFPIAKIVSLLAIGYTLDEIPNDITKQTPACFEPTIDYVVTKWPRFTFEKFPQTAADLTVQMKSVGEAMAIGRTFRESLQKAIRSMEIDRWSLDGRHLPPGLSDEQLIAQLRRSCWDRMWYVAEAYRRGMATEQIHE